MNITHLSATLRLIGQFNINKSGFYRHFSYCTWDYSWAILSYQTSTAWLQVSDCKMQKIQTLSTITVLEDKYSSWEQTCTFNPSVWLRFKCKLSKRATAVLRNLFQKLRCLQSINQCQYASSSMFLFVVHHLYLLYLYMVYSTTVQTNKIHLTFI